MFRTDIPWREGHEEDAESENKGGNNLECEGNTPCSLTLRSASSSDVVGAVVDPERHQDTKCDG